MITFFTIPKPFSGHIATIQRNAISSWSKLLGAQVLVFGNESGVAEFCHENSLQHIPEIKTNQFCTPLLSWVFNHAQALAKNDLIAYVNADIILMQDFYQAAKAIADWSQQAVGKSRFLMLGQRTDLDLKTLIDFNHSWQDDLKREVLANGKLHGKSGIDYFLFKKGSFTDIPAFAVGRPAWDNWLVFKARSDGMAVVDATKQIMAVHQNHPAIYKPGCKEGLINVDLAGGFSCMATIRDANYLIENSVVQKPAFLHKLKIALLFSAPIRKSLALKRYINNLYANLIISKSNSISRAC